MKEKTHFFNGKSIKNRQKGRIQYEQGQEIGNNGISYIQDVEPEIRLKSEKSKYLISFRKAKFKCHCGKEFVNKIQQIKSNKVKSCGCLRIQKVKEIHKK